ncbi:MAG: hypothetical protein A3J38_05170 [Gammaproteobacteria bacterium RIFCSPHIGHO2_12_FULL_45_9]|nr:MAG: hypothetical protein A3J38_05170 [Gammaproteobacteria bacterium RIFCSPHIGHO2_12_FULL_45_9]
MAVARNKAPSARAASNNNPKGAPSLSARAPTPASALKPPTPQPTQKAAPKANAAAQQNLKDEKDTGVKLGMLLMGGLGVAMQAASKKGHAAWEHIVAWTNHRQPEMTAQPQFEAAATTTPAPAPVAPTPDEAAAVAPAVQAALSEEPAETEDVDYSGSPQAMVAALEMPAPSPMQEVADVLQTAASDASTKAEEPCVSPMGALKMLETAVEAAATLMGPGT